MSKRRYGLVISRSDIGINYYALDGDRIQVGRGSRNELDLPIDSVSGRHCEIKRNSAGHFAIRDLGSTNGTRLNGHEVSEAFAELHPGDEILLGGVTPVRFIELIGIGEALRIKEEPRPDTAPISPDSVNPVAASVTRAMRSLPGSDDAR
ncbi:MAG: FHA domain-containing protein [Verrucomicrobiota bacterium]